MQSIEFIIAFAGVVAFATLLISAFASFNNELEQALNNSQARFANESNCFALAMLYSIGEGSALETQASASRLECSFLSAGGELE